MSFKAFTKFAGGMGDSAANVATWPRACTPASVRPEPCGKTFSPVTRPIAEARVPWIVAASGCTCHPENSEPSYARRSLILRMRMVCSLLLNSEEESFQELAKLVQSYGLRRGRGSCVSYTIAFHAAV